MTDLYVGLGIMAVASLIVLLLTVRWTRSITTRETTGVGIVASLLILVYLKFIWKTTLLANVLPFSNIVVLSNWFPLLAAFLAGIVWTHGYGTRPRRVVFGLTVFCVASWSMISPLVGSPPQCRNEWHESGVCLQTSHYTCTAAAAATLLQGYEIYAEESEMAELCLTRDGTTWQGLFRGLTLKTRGTGYRVDVFECDWKELSELEEPAIISAGIDPDLPFDPIYQSQWGWDPGQLHTVVLLAFNEEHGIVIGDPTVGLEQWREKDLETLFRGRVVRLVKD